MLLQEHVFERLCSNTSKRKSSLHKQEKEFFNLLVRIHFIIMMIWWTGLAPCSTRRKRHASASAVQGHLAYKKTHPLRTLT